MQGSPPKTYPVVYVQFVYPPEGPPFPVPRLGADRSAPETARKASLSTSRFSTVAGGLVAASAQVGASKNPAMEGEPLVTHWQEKSLYPFVCHSGFVRVCFAWMSLFVRLSQVFAWQATKSATLLQGQ